MALIGFEVDDGAINRVQVLPLNHNLRTPAIQTNNWLFWAGEQKKCECPVRALPAYLSKLQSGRTAVIFGFSL